jgi:hypothetical protein
MKRAELVCWLEEMGRMERGLTAKALLEAAKMLETEKKWVGLTNEEMIGVYSSMYGAGTDRENQLEMGGLVEAKLKEKNEKATRAP